MFSPYIFREIYQHAVGLGMTKSVYQCQDCNKAPYPLFNAAEVILSFGKHKCLKNINANCIITRNHKTR